MCRREGHTQAAHAAAAHLLRLLLQALHLLPLPAAQYCRQAAHMGRGVAGAGAVYLAVNSWHLTGLPCLLIFWSPLHLAHSPSS